MSKHQVLFLNGPPYSGKDTAADFAWPAYQARRMQFKTPLIRAVQGLFSLTDAEVKDFSQPPNKDKEQARLHGYSWRQALIWMSENCVKPAFGDTFFGVILDECIKRPTMSKITIIPDSRFAAEAEPVIHTLGGNNCHLFHIHRSGCDWTNDSGSYWTSDHLPVCNIHEVKNEHDLRLYRLQILVRIDKILSIEVERT